MSRAIPATADVVVVGGGILGCAAAWHIRRSTDLSVVVIERMGLGAAATSHAAGLLNRFGATDAVMSLVDRTYAALAELGDILEERLPLVETGTLHLAASEASRANLRAATATAVSHGLRVEHPSRETIEQCLPWLGAGLIREGAFAVDDGFIDPYALAAAYARAARTLGATVASGVAVDGILTRSGRVSGVTTSAGRIGAPVVIAAAGAWSNTLLAPLGAFVPTAPVRSHYWITDRDSLFPDRHPVAFLPDARAYTRPELGALLFGLRDRTSVCADPTALPRDVSGFAFDEDPDGGRALEEGFPDLVRFIPALGRAGIAHYVCGLVRLYARRTARRRAAGGRRGADRGGGVRRRHRHFRRRRPGRRRTGGRRRTVSRCIRVRSRAVRRRRSLRPGISKALRGRALAQGSGSGINGFLAFMALNHPVCYQ